MKKINLLGHVILFLLLFTFVSCEKFIDKTKTELELKKIIFTEAFNVQAKFIGIYQTLDKIMVNEAKSSNIIIDSADVIFRNDSIIIDYGTEYVTCPDGNRRKGMIIGYNTNHLPYASEDCIINFTFNNFWIDDYSVVGSMTSTNNGILGGRTIYTVLVNEGSSISKGGIETSITANYNIGWDRNIDPNSSDDIFYLSITSSGSGTASNGYTYTMSVTEEVIIDNACEFKITKGILRMIATAYPDDVTNISFGDGTCDDAFTISITVNGLTNNLNYSLSNYF